MSARRTAGGEPPPRWPAGRRLLEFAALVALLFVARFVWRGDLAPRSDQECHIGGIALDVLAHGVRFPLLVYAPNEYDNGSFFSGLLTAGSFAILGRRLLALKLVTHLLVAAGALAALILLRRCMAEIGIARRARRLAVLAFLVALALAPLEVTALSMYGVGNHAEGSAIDMLLLALFASRWPMRSPRHAAVSWALVGFAIYLNKGTLLVTPLLAVATLALSWGQPRRLIAAAVGALTGIAPELYVLAQRHGAGWATVASKVERTAPAFPRLFVDDLLTLAESRWALLAWWAVALTTGIVGLTRAWRARRTPPLALALVVGVVVCHLAALTVMAQGSFDAYAIYSYPALCVLIGLMVAAADAHATARWGDRAGPLAGGAAVALTLVVAWPRTTGATGSAVAALWHNQAGAACSWRFAEGFGREWRYGLTTGGESRDDHVIARCRELSDADQRLDCIGGIARELHWRMGGRVEGTPPAALDERERRAYAFHYGTHRKGDPTACRDFTDADLAARCADAVRLECLVFADELQRLIGGPALGAPHCDLPEPPMDGYWAEMRRDLLSRPGGMGPSAPVEGGEGELGACQPVFDACYAAAGVSR
jgi:hypothetical protein